MLSATYRSLLRTPGAAAFFLSATAGRVGIAMTSLGIIWLVHGRTASYAVAGLVTGAFAVAEALVGPQLARLIDHFGQTRVLPPVLLTHTTAVGALLAVVGNHGPPWLMTAGGALVGATIPQLGALSAARWTALLHGGRAVALPTAFALESLGNGLCYLAGPALVTTVGASFGPALGMALATTLVVGGGLAFAAQRRTAPATAGAAERGRAGRSLLRPEFAAQVGVNLTLGLYFGAMQVSVTAFAVEHGTADAAAPLYAVSNCASLLAGWLYGLRRWRGTPRVQLACVTAWSALSCLPLLAADSVPGLGLALAVTGLAVPPILVLSSVLTTASVDRAALTQAFTWLGSASAAGAAGAAAMSGRMVDAYGAHGGFTVAAAATSVMAVLAATQARSARHEWGQGGKPQGMAALSPKPGPESLKPDHGQERERERERPHERVDAGRDAGVGPGAQVEEEAPDRPTELPARSWWAALRGTVREFKEDDLADRAAALTYYGVLALFPALLVLVSLLGIAGESATREILDNLRQLAPGSARDVITDAVEQVRSNGSGVGSLLAVVGLALAVWSASGYIAAFIRASNAVYDMPEGRPVWKVLPLRLILTVVLMVLACASALIVVFTGGLARQAGTALGIGDGALTAWSIAKWPVLLLLVAIMIGLLYWAAPNAKGGGFRWVTPGSFLALLIWMIASAGFAFYVADFASYNKTYGTLAGVIIFLVWLWITNLAVLLGLEFDSELARQRAIAGGSPPDEEPYVAPRDTRSWTDEERRRMK